MNFPDRRFSAVIYPFATHRQSGFAAIAAIFLVVILAALGAFMLTFSNTQQLTAAQDLQGSRASWAARAGLEWGVASVASCATFPETPETSKKALPGATATPATFDGGFTVAVGCTDRVYTEGSTAPNIHIYTITSKASSGTIGSIGYVERSMTATVEPVPP
jgi:MSHA biogenesis protein MshP